ncbi:MAG TPA: hypothetical protein VER39_08845 [Nocardioidaceae bacterium]|nr:hypothetical protein [Nocardioidaceae bacterium]
MSDHTQDGQTSRFSLRHMVRTLLCCDRAARVLAARLLCRGMHGRDDPSASHR